MIGRLRQRSWETPEGQKRTVVEIEVECVGPSLEWAKASVTKTPRDESSAPAFAGATRGRHANGSTVDEEPPF